MSDCQDAVSQLDDDGVVCTARNLQAAKSGDTGGCGAIADLDPCSFVPAPKGASVEIRSVSLRNLSSPSISRANSSQTNFDGMLLCNFDTESPVIGVTEGSRFLVDAATTQDSYGIGSADHYFAYRLVGDTGNGTLLRVTGLDSAPEPFETMIEDVPAGDYEFGSCHEIDNGAQYGHIHFYSGFKNMKVFVLD